MKPVCIIRGKIPIRVVCDIFIEDTLLKSVLLQMLGYNRILCIHSWSKMRRSGYDFLISLRENITLSAGGQRALAEAMPGGKEDTVR